MSFLYFLLHFFNVTNDFSRTFFYSPIFFSKDTKLLKNSSPCAFFIKLLNFSRDHAKSTCWHFASSKCNEMISQVHNRIQTVKAKTEPLLIRITNFALGGVEMVRRKLYMETQSDRYGKALQTGMVNWKSRAFVNKKLHALSRSTAADVVLGMRSGARGIPLKVSHEREQNLTRYNKMIVSRCLCLRKWEKSVMYFSHTPPIMIWWMIFYDS